MHDLAGHIGRIVRRQENKTGHDFFRLTGTPQRSVRSESRRVLRGKGGRNQRRPEWAGRDGIDANPLPASACANERVKATIAPFVDG